MYLLPDKPQLRFTEFEDSWKTVQIGDLLNINYGKDYKHLNKGKYPVLGTGGVMDFVDEYLYSGESILIGRKGTIDKPRFINGSFWTVDTLFYTEITQGIPQFIYYQLNNVNWLKYNEASGVPSLSANNIKKIRVKIPSNDEQIKIANFLSLIDKKISLMQKKHKNIEKYSNKLLNEIINHKYSVPNSNNEWNSIKLSKIGSSFNGLTGKTKEDFGKGNSKYITYTSIFNNYIQDLSALDKVIINDDENQNTVQKGDIFFTTSSETPNEVGMSSVILEDVSNCYLNSFCFGYRLNSLDNYNPLYLVYYFRSLKFRKELYKLAQGSTRFNISKKELLKSEIEIPNIDEQNYYVNVINNCFKMKEEVNNKIKQISDFKKGLLQKMFV